MPIINGNGDATEIHRNETTGTTGVALSSAINNFHMHLKATGRASGTILCYLGELERLNEFFGKRDIGQVTGRHLEKVIVLLSEQCINGTRRTVVTMNRIKSVYRSFFRWACESGYTSRNPAACLSLAKANSRPTIPITLDEITHFLCTIRKSGDRFAGRDEALLATYAFTGIRRSEGLSLRVKDYDPVSLTLYLPRAKGGNSRIQPVPDLLAEILERYMNGLRSNGITGDYAPLFPGRYIHRPLSFRQAQARFDKWKNLSGIRKDLTIHSFRAGFATLLYRTTGDILLVARAMGHSDISTTDRYVSNNMPAVREAMEKTFMVQ